jgi:RNA polymerase sigma-70 factor (ECF subfamily)
VTNAAGLAGSIDHDLALVTRAAGGDATAFDRLIEPRLARLWRIARAIVRDDAIARDVVQDACVQAWRELAGIRDPARFDAWLSQIVVNGCRTELRRTSRRAVREIAMPDASDDAGHPARRGEGLLGDRVVEAEAVRRAFMRLGPDDRSLLVLHYVEDRPLAEIAIALRIPSGTLKWRLARARAALERALEAER